MLVESVLRNRRQISTSCLLKEQKTPKLQHKQKWGIGLRFCRKKSSLEEKEGEQVLPASDNSFKRGAVLDLLGNLLAALFYY